MQKTYKNKQIKRSPKGKVIFFDDDARRGKLEYDSFRQYTMDGNSSKEAEENARLEKKIKEVLGRIQ